MNNEFTQLWPQFSRFVEFEVPQNTFCDNSTNNNKTDAWHQIQIKSVQHLDSLYRLLQTLLNFVNFKLARSDICSCLLNTSTVNSAAAFYMAHCNKAFSVIHSQRPELAHVQSGTIRCMGEIMARCPSWGHHMSHWVPTGIKPKSAAWNIDA